MQVAREAWGCDAPSKGVVFETTCSACAGLAGGEDECAECGGTGIIGHRRCPTALMEETPLGERAVLEGLLRAYIQYDARQALPASGGWGDQSAYFAKAVDIIDSERGRYAELVHAKRERERKANEIKAKREQGRGPVRRATPRRR